MPPGYQFWSAMFYYALLRGVVGETTRANPLYLIHYLNPHWGIGFTTLMQLFTPPILVFTGLMMRRTWRRSNAVLIFAGGEPDGVEALPGSTGRGRGPAAPAAGGGRDRLGRPGLPHRPPAQHRGYLIGSGIVFGLVGVRWTVRFRGVLEAPPSGAAPTGEVYSNPGATGPVAAFYRGIRRVYVRASP